MTGGSCRTLALGTVLAMTVIVVVPGQAEPWKVANAGFASLVAVAVERADDDTAHVLATAMANHGLFFDQLDTQRRHRVAAVLARSASQLRQLMLIQPAADESSLALAASLPVLQMWLEGLIEETDGSA
jgi:hypothetical protein